MRVVHVRAALAIFIVALSAQASDLVLPQRPRRAVPVSAVAAEHMVVASSMQASKIEAGLALALRDPSFRERLTGMYKSGASSQSSQLPFAVEQGRDGTTLIPLFIDTRDLEKTRAAISAARGTVSTIVKNHIVAHVPLAAIETLAANEEVDRIEPSYFEHVALDVSRKEVNADKVQSGIGLSAAFTGKGVVVGVLDTGIDWSHPDFKDASGHTRIVTLWDETGSGKPPAGTSKGYECSRSDIDSAQCPEQDTNGHGTHVAGIAAGNGRARSGGTFTGIAPEADLVIVKAGNGSFSRTNIVDGVSYIFRTATALGKPAVVNLSLGGHSGAHDGTSSYEQALTALLDAGKLIVVANGNEGAQRIHAGYDAAGTSYSTGNSTYWNITKDSKSSTIDMWYSGSINAGIVANVNVDGKLTSVFSTPAIASGASLDRTQVTAAGSSIGFVTVQTEVTSAGTKHLVAVIDNNSDSSIDLSQVKWEFFSFGSGHLDAWITDGGEFSAFNDPANGFLAGDMNMTVGMPATGTNMIAVGSYTTKTTWTDVDGTQRVYRTQNPIGQVSAFSSLGPTRDGRRRPIVSAPGEAIASVLSSALDANDASRRPYLLSGGSYLIEQGTSQASPHVTGIVAMMMQAKADLNVNQAYTILRGKARKDAFTTSTPNNAYGDGKVDALAYIKEVGGDSNPVTPTVCSPNATTLCLSGNRFAVSANWKSPDAQGQGQAVALTADTGYFWFFSSSNVEMVIKVLNACSLNSRVWVFAGGLTNVQVTMTVIDTKTGIVKTYNNPQSTAFQPIQDVGAFATCP